MSGRRSREKGRRFQSDLAKRWRDSGLYPDATSTQGSQARKLGAEPSDIGHTPWAIEAKDQARPNVWAAMQQLEEAAAKVSDDRPRMVVAHRKGTSHDDSLVCMRLSTFEALMRAHREGYDAGEAEPLPGAGTPLDDDNVAAESGAVAHSTEHGAGSPEEGTLRTPGSRLGGVFRCHCAGQHLHPPALSECHKVGLCIQQGWWS